MNIFQTVILAIVEGLTEFLPISSTGHMIIVQKFLGVPTNDPFVQAFTFIIQFGAILSVLCLYWRKFFLPQPLNSLEAAPQMSGLWGLLLRYWQFYRLLIIGVIPAVVVGLICKRSGLLSRLLDSVETVAVMLVLGGLFMLVCDKLLARDKPAEITPRRAFWIGCFQCIAVIPGTSRSLVTIVGGMQQKLTRRQAAEFSFFLAIPTMAGATLVDVWDVISGETAWATPHNLFLLALGCVVAFIVAILAMKWFIAFISKFGFKAFGIYRIILGGAIILLLLAGQSLQMVD